MCRRNVIKSQNFCASKDTTTSVKRNGRKCLQIMYLMKNQLPEHTKDPVTHLHHQRLSQKMGKGGVDTAPKKERPVSTEELSRRA